MAIPSNTTMVATPQATVTVAEGISKNSGTAPFVQRVTGNVFIAYDGVPYGLAQSILQSSDPDTAIATQLAAYPKRVLAV